MVRRYAVPGGLECHNFSEELSLTTLTSNKHSISSGKSVADNTMARSMFSIVSLTGNDSNQDSDGEEVDTKARPQYTFEGMDLIHNQQEEGARSENIEVSNKRKADDKQSLGGKCQQQQQRGRISILRDKQ